MLKERRKYSRMALRSSTKLTSISNKKKENYYYLRENASGKWKYLGNESNPIVKSVKEAKYLTELLDVVKKDISILENLSRNYVIPDFENVMGRLPQVYQSSQIERKGFALRDAAAWKEKREAEKKKYPPFRPDELVHEALDGTMMRSKSETQIANYLLSRGITYVYEYPLTYNGETILPDFMILSPVDNKTVIFVEHQGMMFDDGYIGKFIRTVQFYLKTKLVPNKDVFFTFNHADGHTDMRQLDCILRIAFGLDAEKTPRAA